MPRPASPSSVTLPSGGHGVAAVLAVLLVCTATAPGAVHAQSAADAASTRFLRQPSVSATEIAFVHANDVWVVDRSGGDARRLTTSEGAETEPAFSADGAWIAFTGEYAGNQDVYLVAASGGQPQRLTWHPGADVVQGWTADGDILFRSSREAAPTRLWKFYSISPDGGFPVSLPVHQAYQGEMSDDGAWLAYQEIGLWDPEWRNYRGGQAQPVRTCYDASLRLRLEIGDRRGEGWMLLRLARVHAAVGRRDSSRTTAARAAAIAVEIGDEELTNGCLSLAGSGTAPAGPPS